MNFCNYSLLLRFTILFIISVKHLSWCYVNPPLIQSSSSLTNIITLNTSINQLIIHDKSVFVGGVNKIFRLNSDNLTIDQEQTIGPTDDNPYCLPFPEPCQQDRKLMDTSVVNMAVINFPGKKPPVLLACLSTDQGMCRLMPLSDLTKSRFLGSPNQTVNFLASRKSSYIVISNFSNRHAVFVAHSHDDRKSDLQPPTLSSRYITSKGWSYSHDEDNLHTYMKIKPEFNNLPIRYIYGFNHSDYVYFLKIEPKSLDPSNDYQNSAKVTKLIRICANDTSFHSYTEIGLVCSGSNEAQTATFGKLDKYYQTYSDHIDNSPVPKDLGLFVSFKSKKNADDSRICLYSLAAIHAKYDDAINRCFHSSDGSRVAIFTGLDAKCVSGQQKTVCGSSLNNYIAHPDSLDGTVVINEENTQITSLNTVIQDGKLVTFAATKQGSIRKISEGKQLFSINISASPINYQSAIDENEEFIYYASDDRLIKFPIKLCSVYPDCGSCITAQQDPLHCIWNGKTCENRSSNQTIIDYCEPKIVNFTPSQGPIGGQTLITIKGKDLGTLKGRENKILVAGHICTPIQWNNDYLKCQTTPVTNAISGPIVIIVNENTGSYNIRGSFQTKDHFHYQIPEVTDIEPQFAPRAGNVYVNIKGVNLDVGNMISIKLSDHECKEVKRTSSIVKCLVAPYEDRNGKSMKGNIDIQIDGQKLPVDDKNFTYMSNPAIDKITPNTVLPHIPINLTVMGSNLTSLYKPQIKCSYKNIHLDHNLSSDCYVNNDTQMMCNSPTSPKLNISNPLSVKCGFSSTDGEVLSSTLQTLIFYPMPLFNNDINIETTVDGKIRLKMEGRHLTTKYKPHIWLSRGDITDTSKVLCHGLISQDEKNLVCDLNFDGYSDNPSKGSWRVFALIGNTSRLIGTISLPSDYRIPIIATTVLSIIFVIIISVISLAIFFKKRCYLEKKTRPTPLAEYGRGNGYQGPQGDYPRGEQRNSNQPLLLPVNTFMLTDDKREELVSEELLIPRDDLQLVAEIGEGNFGIVFKGLLKISHDEDPREVAVKTLKPPRLGYLSQDLGEQFLEEGLLMKDFNHPNVISLVGITFNHDGWPLIITPFMAKGNLWAFIGDENNQLTLYDLIKFGIQIAEGMSYLASHKFVHRDLAARNCLLDENYLVKISDFGLARDVYTRAYYSQDVKVQKSLPRKWMALESLEHGIYSHKTDVWSFGITLWELVTRGDPPYADVNDWDLKSYLKSGRRLQRPPVCPDEIYLTMTRCWFDNPEFRPTFDEILKDMKDAIDKSETIYAELKMNKFIDYVNCPPEFSNPIYDNQVARTT